ncbi:MAG: L-histidine N(alpha)-methyltransferase [Thermodesulfobacteriota bacterium]
MISQEQRGFSLFLTRDLGACFVLKKGETIRTEICRKFRRDGAEAMVRDAGMEVSRWYSDATGWFSLVEMGSGLVS